MDLDLADYVSPAANFSNVLTGFNVSDLTSAYGTTAKLYKPDGTLLTTVNSAATGSGVNFGYTETDPGDVIYKLEVTDDLGRKSKYNLPRKWINYAMETTSTPGFQKFALEGNEYTSTVTVPNLSSSSKARIHKTTDHGYMGIKFRIQGRNAPSDDWVDVDDTGENENADESAEFLAFGNYKYQRVWVKPTAKATTTVSSSNVVTLTLSNVTEDVTTKTITGMDPFHVDETSNIFVFEETAKIGTIPYTVTVGTETYTNAVTATTEEVSTVPNTDMTAAGPNKLHDIQLSQTGGYMSEVSGNGKYIAYNKTNDSVVYILKGDPVSGYADYNTITYSQVSTANLVGSMTYDGKYIIIARRGSNSYHYEIWKHDESAETYTKLSQTVQTIDTSTYVHKPAFVPAESNYNFAISGHNSSNGQNFSVQLYKHNAGTDTWTAQTIISNPRPSSVQGTTSNRSMQAKSFTKDGKYLMFGNTSTYGGYDVFNVDFDENTVTHAGNWVNNGDIGHSGAITSDGKYILLFAEDSNSRKVFKNNDAGDWSSSTDVTSDFTFADADNDQGHDICFFGDNSEYFVSTGASGGAVRVYSWYAKKEVTLAFANPTLTLTGQDVTISSAKLYRDDVLFHTYGTESNVVLRTDQTGTYQAIVNDVYYSNRITPDFTTTRSVSAPQLEFDGYNKLTFFKETLIQNNVIVTDTRTGGAWGCHLNIDAIYTGEGYQWKLHKDDSSHSLVPDHDFDDDSAHGIYRYLRYTGTEDSGSWTFYNVNSDNSQGSQDTVLKIYSSNGSNEVTNAGIDSTLWVWSWNMSFSGHLTKSSFTPTSTTLGLPDGTTRDLTTQSNVYIYKSGTYTANVQTSDTFAYLSNVATIQTVTQPTLVNTISITNGDFSGYNYQHEATDTTNTYYEYNLSLNATGSTYFIGYNWTTKKWFDTNPTDANNTFGISATDTTATSRETIENPAVVYVIGTNNSQIVLESQFINPYYSGPSLTFDGFNKLSIENITQTSSTITYPNDSTVNTNTASSVYVKDIGEYVLEASDANTFFTSNVEVGALDTVPGFTAAFHHGAFSASDYSSAYSTVAEAATAGFVYSDTAAGEYTWGTLAHVKERENPDFTANSTLHTDYNSTYGWTTNSGWEVSAKDESSSTYAPWKAFNKNDGGDTWLSGSAPSTSSPQWIKIKYPSSQVIKSYVIKARDNASPRFPTAWKLQGANTDIGDTDTGWTDIGTEQTVSLWSVASEKSFDVSSNTTVYQYYRLRITGARESASLSNSDYVAIGEWFLNTVNSENTTNHDQYTRYSWTPSALLTANVLRVAGGGGGGSTRGAGGGAGGLLYSENVSLSGAKSIAVANGGRGCKVGGSGNQSSIQQGFDTTFSGLTTSVGGGRGAFSDPGRAGSGGSGGGGGPAFPTAGTGISGQGYAGGNSNSGDNYNGGGGGGAGGVGATGPGVGGVGLDYSSVFGTTYGVSGWFAGGGGGANQSGGKTGGQGGGGSAGGVGTKHTGGGGGGLGTSGAAGSGGSGIVIIKKIGAANPLPALNFDGYNKLSIDNVSFSPDSFPNIIYFTGGYWGTSNPIHRYQLDTSQTPIDGSAYYYELWQGTNTTNQGDNYGSSFHKLSDGTTEFRCNEGDNTNIPPHFKWREVAGTGSWESNLTTKVISAGNELELYGDGTNPNVATFTITDSMIFKPPSPDTSVTIKKDDVAFATTTSNTVYIRDEGTYTAEVRGSGAYVTEVSKVVSGDITEFPNYVNATSFYYGGGVVDNTGKLYTWGHNAYGDSGRGASDRVPTHLSSISDPVSNVWRGDPGITMAAKTSTDKWYMWGRNTYSAVLGNTTNTGNVTVPEDVTAKVTTYFGDQTVSANKILKIVMGSHHAAALTAGGKVWSWGGDNTYYATGTGTNNNTVLVTPVLLTITPMPPTSGQTGYEINATLNSSTTVKIRANGSTFTFNSQTCWYYDRLAGSNNTWYTQQLGYVPSTNTFIEASISGNPDQVYHNKTSSNVTKGSITVPPEGILLSNDASSWNGAALFANPFTSTQDSGHLTGITDIQSMFHGTAAFDSSGNVWFWGGSNTSMQYAYPTKLLDSSSIPGVVGMTTNGQSIYAWKSDGTFYTRGAGNYGQLANGADNDQYTSWQTVTTLQGKTIKKVFGGNENIFAWTDDGVYGVGRNNNYKLGEGSLSSRRNIWHKSTTLSALSIKEIDFGHATGLVLTTDGKGYMWGEDASNSMANALSGHQSGAAEATSISALSLVHIPSPSITYDGKNKLTVNGTNYEDTATVSDPNGSTYNIGTAKTMYVKDVGEYVFKISGTDKYADSNVYVSSVDLAGATTKPISFDGYNKLTLIDAGANAVSNVTLGATKYDMGSASTFYIKDQGTYGLEMSGSNVFALSNTAVSSISSLPDTLLHLDFESGGLVSTGLNTTQYKYGSSSLYRNNSSVTVSNDGSYNIGNTSSAKATIMLWVRPESYPSYSGNANRIVVAADGRSESSPSYKKWAIVLREHSSIDEEWQFHYPNSSNSTKKVSYTPADVPVGAWYHVCVTIESGSLKFYIDGVDVTSSLTGNKSDIESAWAGFNDDEGFKFCKTDANYLKGWVDDFKLFNSVLTLSEITAHMNASKLSSPSLTFDNYNKLTVSNFNSAGKEWPPASFTSPTFSTTTITGVTTTNNAKDQTWTISGAAYGNGEYSASFNDTVYANQGYYGPVRCFDKVNDGYSFHTQSIPTGIVTLNMPENIILDSYELRNRSTQNTNQNFSPRDWTLEASNDGTTWVVLDTQSNQSYNPDVQGDEVSKRTYTVSNNSTSYSRYRLNITANDGGVHLVIGQWKLFASNPRTATLTDPNGSTYALGQTQDTIYIKDTGNYTLDVQNNDQKAIVTKTVGTISTPVISPFTSTQNDITITGGTENPARYYKFDTLNSNSLKLFYELYTISNDVHQTNKGISFYYDANDNLVVNHNDTNGSGDPGAIENVTTSSGFLNSGVVNASPGDIIRGRPGDNTSTLRVQYTVPTFNQGTPSLNFDNFNKLTFANVDSDATSNIDFFSNTYEMGSRKELIINDGGTYHANIYSSNTLALVKNQVTGVALQTLFTPGLINTFDGNSNSEQLGNCWGGIGGTLSMNSSGTLALISGMHYSSSTGRVYLYEKGSDNTWSLKFTFTSPRSTGDQFGHDIAINSDGSRIFILSGRYNVSGHGRIYIYDGPTWSTTPTTTLEEPSGQNGFWSRMSINSTGTKVAATGVVYPNTTDGDGRVYIFTHDGTNWGTTPATLDNPSSGTGGEFGYSTQMNTDGTRMLIGETTNDEGGTSIGRAYAYALESGTWTLKQDLAGHSVNERFGTRISMTPSGSRAVICAPYNDETVSDGGRVYIYDYDSSAGTWSHIQDISAVSTTSTGGSFGWDAKINDSGTRVLIGAPFVDDDGTNRGRAYVFDRQSDGTWTLTKTLSDSGQNSSEFGRSVGMDSTGNIMLIAAPKDDQAGTDRGRIYYYEGSGGPPSLTFDGYNKLTAPVLDASFTATRLSDWDNSNQSKTIVANSGDWPESTAGITEHNVLQNGDKSYQKTNGGTGRDSAQLFTTVISGDWANASHGVSGTHSPMTWGYKFTTGAKKVDQMILTQPPSASHTAGNVTIKYWDGSAMVTVSNQSPTGMSSQSYNSSTTFTFDSVSAQYWQIDCYRGSSNGTTYTGIHGWQLLSGQDPVTTVITKGSDSYDIGTASSIYIDAAGTYDAQAKNSNTFVIKTSNVVSGSITRNQIWNATETQILYASDAQASDDFGWSVSIDGDYAIVGARYEDTGGSQAGAVYIFKRDGTSWSQQQIIHASDAQTNDQFGHSVGISGDYAIVGAPYEDKGADNGGSVYIYKRNTSTGVWGSEQNITASNAGGNDYFGWSVSISGDYAIVGANGENSASGAVYIYKRNTSTGSWGSEQLIRASDAQGVDEFGFDVSISGDYAIVGSRNEDTGGTDAGAAYIFKYDATYPPDDLPPVDSVGTGFNYKRYTALDTSTHYVYKMWRNSAGDWRTPSPASTNTIKVLKTDSTDWSDNDTTDTNPEYVDTTTYSGKVSLGQSAGPTENYRFSVPTFGRWSEQQKIQSSDIQAGDSFGGAVSIDGDYVTVGANYEDENGTSAGAAYIFKKTSTTLTGTKNPYFTDASTIVTDSNWSSSTGFEITASADAANQPGYHAFDNTYTAANSWESTWLSGSNSMPAWVQIQYPQDVVIKSYTIVGRDDTNRYYPTSWQLQGATASAPSTYVNLETTSGNRTASSWAPLAEVSHDVNSSNTAYRYFRLYVNSANENNQVSINELKLFTTPLSGQSSTVEESWTQEAKLLPSDGTGGDELSYGGSIDISGDTVVVGARVADPGSISNAGAAWVFERSGTTWTEVKKITASDGQANDEFGISVAIDGTTIFVGARTEDTKGASAGAAYVYEKVYAGPTLTYDNANKLSLTGVTTPSSNLTVGTNTYDIGSATRTSTLRIKERISSIRTMETRL